MLRTWTYSGQLFEKREYKDFTNVLSESINLCKSAGTFTGILATSLISLAVVCVACSRASIFSFMVATSSSDIFPTANIDTPCATILNVACELFESHVCLQIIWSTGAVIGTSALSNLTFFNCFVLISFQVLSVIPVSTMIVNKMGKLESSPYSRPHMGKVGLSLVEIIRKFSSHVFQMFSQCFPYLAMKQELPYPN